MGGRPAPLHPVRLERVQGQDSGRVRLAPRRPAPEPSRLQPILAGFTAVAVLAIAGSVMFWDAGEPATTRTAPRTAPTPVNRGGAPIPAAGSRSPATTTAVPTPTAPPPSSPSSAVPSRGATGGAISSPSITAPDAGPSPADTAATVTPPPVDTAGTPPTNEPLSPSSNVGPTRRGDVSGVDGGLADTTK